MTGRERVHLIHNDVDDNDDNNGSIKLITSSLMHPSNDTIGLNINDGGAVSEVTVTMTMRFEWCGLDLCSDMFPNMTRVYMFTCFLQFPVNVRWWGKR